LSTILLRYQRGDNIRRQIFCKLKCLFTVYRLFLNNSLCGYFHCELRIPLHEVVDSTLKMERNISHPEHTECLYRKLISDSTV